MTLPVTRRELGAAAAGVALALAARGSLLAADEKPMRIIDTHQHLWDLDKLKLPWLEGAKGVLAKSYRPADYKAATEGLDLRSVYMEVDVAPEHHLAEAKYVFDLCRDKSQPTLAAVVGGRPASPDFGKYLDDLARAAGDAPLLRGVRQVLHGEGTKPGYCLGEEFVRGVRLLGQRKLSFDLCLRPKELADGRKLTELCPDTEFVLDHCGNADPKAFGKFGPDAGAPEHEPDPWKRDIAALAKRPNVICKISGIVARAPAGWKAADLAPIVNHCLESFGPDRVVFGGDWPVCLLGAKLKEWVAALDEIIAARPVEERKKLWSANAMKFYRLKDKPA
jgi:L-fuconolactonase